MITAQSSYRGGQYLNLLFTVGAGTAITPNDIFAQNTAYSPYKVVGFDTATNSSVTMTGKVKTTLEIVLRNHQRRATDPDRPCGKQKPSVV
jgi:hypothetical protein